MSGGGWGNVVLDKMMKVKHLRFVFSRLCSTIPKKCFL